MYPVRPETLAKLRIAMTGVVLAYDRANDTGTSPILVSWMTSRLDRLDPRDKEWLSLMSPNEFVMSCLPGNMFGIIPPTAPEYAHGWRTMVIGMDFINPDATLDDRIVYLIRDGFFTRDMSDWVKLFTEDLMLMVLGAGAKRHEALVLFRWLLRTNHIGLQTELVRFLWQNPIGALDAIRGLVHGLIRTHIERDLLDAAAPVMEDALNSLPQDPWCPRSAPSAPLP